MKEPSAHRWGLVVVVLVAASLGALGVIGVRVWWLAHQQAATRVAVERTERSVDLALRRARRVAAETVREAARERFALAQAIAQARADVNGVVGPWQAAPEAGLRGAFVGLVDAGNLEGAGALLQWWLPSPDDADGSLAFVDYAIGTGELERAREVAWEVATRFPAARAEAVRRFYAAHTADPAFWHPDARTVEPSDELTAVRFFDVASSVLFLFERDERIESVLKPLQTNRFSNYRGELATYRLCALIHCAVSIPHNEEIRVREGDLVALMGLPDVESVRAIRRHDYAPLFVEEDGERWLYGTLKDWVPGFTHFPIESLDGWRHLVDGSMSARELERTTLREALDSLARERPDWWAAFEARSSGTTTVELAHQLSDMHVLDALINNWDRYSSLTPGSNCQFNHGRIVSIDNGASFHTREEWRGRDALLRLRRVRTFSRATLDAVRWMDTEALYEVLFPPNPHFEDERERWQLFLERRQELLEWVDELVERYGDERVFVFP